jgi:ribokinase
MCLGGCLVKNRVLVVGSTNVDLVTFMKRVPDGGETVIGREFQQHFGGKGANQAVMAARCGVPVSMIAGVGSDDFGNAMLKNLEQNGVDVTPIFKFSGSSGIAHIWVEDNGENRITIIPGANFKLSEKDVVERIDSLSDVGFLVAQCEVPIEIVSAAFKKAKNSGITTIFNPAPFLPLTEELLANTDWLVVNETEFSQLHPEGFLPANDEVIRSLPRQGKTVITLGSEGAVLVEGVILRIPAPKKSPIDTTGAGDCLIGAFAAGLAMGLHPEKAIKLGITCASESVMRAGAQTSYLNKEEVSQLLKTL